MTTKVPILFMIYNRRHLAVEAFASIRAYKPERLYIAADGPRDDCDKTLCVETQRAVLDLIDWPCHVETLIRDNNIGCDLAVCSAIDWFFGHEEFGIIVEDDVVLAPGFYTLCEDLGSRYADDDRVMAICARYHGRRRVIDTTYGFTPSAYFWGWATWRRAWQKMDMSMSHFPSTTTRQHIRAFGLCKGLMLQRYYWSNDYRQTLKGAVKQWDTIWQFNIFANSGVAVIPAVNLALNIGCSGTQGTHYTATDIDLYSYLSLGDIDRPIIHPEKVLSDSRLAKVDKNDFIRIRWAGLLKKLSLKA